MTIDEKGVTMFEKEAEDKAIEKYPLSDRCDRIDLERNLKYEEGFKDGAEFGYNKAKEEMQKQDYSLFDFVMQYENGKFKCKYKSGKVFESVDGKIWKENCNSKRERIKVEK